MKTPSETAQMDQLLAGLRDAATGWAMLYNTMVSEGVPRMDAVQIVLGWIRSTYQR